MIFDANLKLIKDRRAQYFKQQEEDKTENLIGLSNKRL
jgi:hypothetical protein